MWGSYNPMQPTGLRALALSLTVSSFLVLHAAHSLRAQSGETADKANERLRTLVASNSSRVPPPSDYVIGAGDLINVQVFDVPEISRELRVSQTGPIARPLVKVRLQVAGLTEIQSERKITEVLEANGLVSHPEVSVTVKEKKSRPITIVGAGAHPMVYEADRQVKLIDVLAQAGGITPDAADHVIVTRPERDTTQDAPPALSAASDTSPAGATKPAAADSAEPPQIPPPLVNTITVNLGQILEAGDMANN